VIEDRNRLMLFARDSLGLDAGITLQIEPLGGRGSDRTYYRVKWGDSSSAILAHYDASRVENSYYAEISLFLEDIGVPIPHLISHDPTYRLIVMEDLGTADLYTLRSEPWTTRSDLYKAVLDITKRLHSFPTDAFPDNVRLMDGFGRDLYVWEKNYFLDHFVKGVCHIEIGNETVHELDAELDRLVSLLLESPLSLIHRDLQSQNIMVRKNEVFLIDFQGMRKGNPYYDLGSLLFDPYVQFSSEEREELLAHYFRTGGSGDWSSFSNRFFAASSQRLMQALGAYGYLGLEKRLPHYLRHIPAGLSNLMNAAEQSGFLPSLFELCQECQSSIDDHSYLNRLPDNP
jgi:N-acetylmuramate 1-kinase